MENSKIYSLAVRKYGNDNIIVVYDSMTDDFFFFDLSKSNSRDAEIGYVNKGEHEGRYDGVVFINGEYVCVAFLGLKQVAEFIEKQGWIFISDYDDLKK